jgi:hypothetical protein
LERVSIRETVVAFVLVTHTLDPLEITFNGSLGSPIRLTIFPVLMSMRAI